MPFARRCPSLSLSLSPSLAANVKSEKNNSRLKRGARKLTGENLKVVWAEFSALSLAIFLCMQ